MSTETNKKSTNKEVSESTSNKVVTNQETVLTPKLMEIEKVEDHNDLKYGQCVVEIISGNDKGKSFVTSIRTAERYYSDTDVFKIVKKN